MPERETIPMTPFLWICPGMIPILHSSGVMTPGQLGPTSRVFVFSLRAALTFIISSTGMPSVMQMTSFISASIASRMASAANGGGTKITLASAPVFCIALSTVSKTGRFRCVCPPFPGVTPPTIFVPYSMACCEWNVP